MNSEAQHSPAGLGKEDKKDCYKMLQNDYDY